MHAAKSPGRHDLAVIGYLRVSTEKQVSEGHRLGTQRDIIEAWCRDNLTEGPYTLEFIEDPGVSAGLGWEPAETGKGKFRRGLAQVVRRIEEQGVDIVVVHDLDRFGRDTADWALFAKRYVATGRARFVSIADRLDLSEGSDLLHSELLAMVAAFGRRNTQRKVRAALRKRKAEGLPSGRHFGYRSVPPAASGARPTIEPDPEQAPWVPQVFDWCLRGWGERRIAGELDRQDAPLPAGAHCWSRGAVGRILHNPLHYGHLEFEGKLIPAHDYGPPLVERSVWEAVQQELARRRHEGKHPIKQPIQPLYKIGRCGACHQPLQMIRQVRTRGAYAYRCRGSDWDFKRTCRGWAKDARLVDRVVLRQLSAFLGRPAFQRLVSDEARQDVLSEQVEQLTRERDRLERTLAEKGRQAKLLLDVYVKGKVSPEAYEDKYDQIQRDTEGLQLELEGVELRLRDEAQRRKLLAEVERAVTQLPALWQQLNPEERRKLLQEVIEYCYIDPLGGKRHRVRLKFHFLPEVVEDLPFAKARTTGLLDDVEHISRRELAHLALHSEGWTDERIRAHWGVTPQALSALRTSVFRRLEVDTVREAVRLAQTRIDRERETLPLGPTDWHPNRKDHANGEVHLRPRYEEALVRYIGGASRDEIAQAMGIATKTVDCFLWEARTALGCQSLDDATEKYLEMKGGHLPSCD